MAPWSPVLRPCREVRAGAQRLALGVGTCGQSRQVDMMAGVWDLEGAPETLWDTLAEGCAALPTATPEDGALSAQRGPHTPHPRLCHLQN